MSIEDLKESIKEQESAANELINQRAALDGLINGFGDIANGINKIQHFARSFRPSLDMTIESRLQYLDKLRQELKSRESTHE